MNPGFSLTIAGLFTLVLMPTLIQLGFSESCAGEISNQLPVLAGVLFVWWRRVRVGDITWYGFTK